MNQKKSVTKRRKYDAAFKSEVLQMISNGRTVGEVAQALGIGENLIYKWKSRQTAVDQPDRAMNQQASVSDLQSENERLKSALLMLCSS